MRQHLVNSCRNKLPRSFLSTSQYLLQSHLVTPRNSAIPGMARSALIYPRTRDQGLRRRFQTLTALSTAIKFLGQVPDAAKRDSIKPWVLKVLYRIWREAKIPAGASLRVLTRDFVVRKSLPSMRLKITPLSDRTWTLNISKQWFVRMVNFGQQNPLWPSAYVKQNSILTPYWMQTTISVPNLRNSHSYKIRHIYLEKTLLR